MASDLRKRLSTSSSVRRRFPFQLPSEGPAHLTGTNFSIHVPDEMIDAIPNMLDFKPKESVALAPMRSGPPTAHIDLPTTPRAQDLAWRAIREGMSRYGHEFAARLDTIRSDIHHLLRTDRPTGLTSSPATWGSRQTAARDCVARPAVDDRAAEAFGIEQRSCTDLAADWCATPAIDTSQPGPARSAESVGKTVAAYTARALTPRLPIFGSLLQRRRGSPARTLRCRRTSHPARLRQ
ncbi:hypothetical protein BJ980_000187 [Nocardioides daedukensis]|uniref:Uncharacterized protein n=1 Tax=Nocardioides daedukensis TaxID=634462 RepID=A0A7Y9S024_9ACTN|nr:hypothetical protein [Nocardioides daedukensis]